MSSTSSPETTKALVPKPLSGFIRLAAKARLYQPPKSSAVSTEGSSPPAPTTIILCGWMNAAPKHVEYYAKTYMRLYPSARIIVTSTNTFEFLFQSETRRRRDIKEVVTALLAQDQEKERILIHALSNGGAKRVYGIAGAYRAATGKPLPVKALILDSAPGIPQFRRDMHALTLPFKKFSWFLWIPAVAATLAIVSAVFVTVNFMPRWFWKELVWAPTDGVNDVKLIEKRCVRGYVYSKEDLAIDANDVERHAAVAEKNGYAVMKKQILGAQHVQMFRGEGGESDYWEYIESIWGTAIKVD